MSESTPTTVPPRSGARSALIFAVIAISLGLWLFLDTLGVPLPSFRRYWPVFLIIGGLASLADFLWLSRQPRSAGHAMFGFGLGMLFLALSLGWTRVLAVWDWFPGLPLVLGLSFLATWFAAGRDRNDLLSVGVVFSVLGMLGFAVRYPVIRNLLPSGQLIWAFALLAGGGFVLWKLLARGRPA